MDALDLSITDDYYTQKHNYEAQKEYEDAIAESDANLNRIFYEVHDKYLKFKKKYRKSKKRINSAIEYINDSTTIPENDKAQLLNILSK